METFLSKNLKNRTLCNALLDLVTFLQFRKREKHQWKTNGITLPWVFFTFFKLYKWHQTAQSVSYVEYGDLF